MPEAGEVVAALGQHAHSVGKVDVDDLGEGQLLVLATVGGHHQAQGLALLQLGQARLFLRVARLGPRHLGAQGLHPRAARLALQLELPQAEPDLLLLVIDGADLALLDARDLPPELLRLGQASLQLGHGGRESPGHHLVAVLHGRDGADQGTPLRPVDDGDVGRVGARRDARLVHPDEVGAVEVAVADLDLDPVVAGLAGNGLPRHHRAGQDPARP